MTIYNLTPHSIEIYNEGMFVNLQQVNATTWVADKVEGLPLQSFPSDGVARLATSTEVIQHPILGGQIVKTQYGEITGLPENVQPEDYLIVSLPLQSGAKASGHPLAGQMICPYKVVRSRENGSMVLGAMGFTF